MVRISSSSMGRGLALVLLIGLGILTPLEALAEEDQAARSRQTSPAEREDSKPEAEEPESEFEVIRTPFGTIRRPKSETRPASSQATPAPAPQAAPEAAADSPADPQAAPAQAGEEPPDPAGEAPAEPAGEAPADPAGEAPAAPAGDAPETVPEPAGGQPAPSPPAGDPAVGFNCVQCSLAEFVRSLAGELELNYLLDPGVQGTVNIHTYGRMRRSDLRSLLETVLEINGAAMVRQGAVYRILPSQNARQLPLQVRQGGGPAAERVLQVVPLNFVPAAEMSQLLTPYLSSGGDITYHQGSNFLILSDTPANLGKLLELIRVFDAEVFGDKRVRIYPLEHSRATGLALELGGIFAGVASAEASPIRFLPIARLNSVLAIASGEAGFAEVDRWVARLDRAGLNREIRNYFVKVQNGDAVEIARLLREVYERSRRDAEGPLPPGGQDPLAGPGEDPEDLRPDIRIVADPQNNALIVQCSPEDFELIQETIRELDRVPRQVLINVRIYEVVLTDELSLGVSAFLQDRNRPTVPSPSATTASFGAGGAVSAGLEPGHPGPDGRHPGAGGFPQRRRDPHPLPGALGPHRHRLRQRGRQHPGRRLHSHPHLPGSDPRRHRRRQPLFQHHQQPQHRGHPERHPPHQRRRLGHPGGPPGGQQPGGPSHGRHPVPHHQHSFGRNSSDHQERPDHRHRGHHLRDQGHLQEPGPPAGQHPRGWGCCSGPPPGPPNAPSSSPSSPPRSSRTSSRPPTSPRS